MGADFGVYAGWCFQIPKVAKEQVDQKFTCGNTSCSAHDTELRGKASRAKFCQECSEPIRKIESSRLVNEHLSLEDVGDEWADIFWEQESPDGTALFWIPGGFGSRMGEEEDNEPVVLQELDRESVSKKFEDRYGELLNVVKEKYGIELQPVYVVVPYWN